MDILRTARDGCWQLATNAWGTFLRPIDDPDANVEITDEQLKGFELRDDIQPMPAELWQRWVQLCFHMTEKDRRNLEVSCRLLRHEDDKSRWRILVPKQEVSGASVRVKSFDQAIDIATGEIIEQYPPAGWIPCGSSHSHNTMQAFFSGTDDQFELGDPGLHIVVGSINTTTRSYTIKASVTANNRRFLIDYSAVLDATPIQNITYHPDVLDLIQLETPKIQAWTPYSASKLATTGKPGYSWTPTHKKASAYSSWHDTYDWGWGWDDGDMPLAQGDTPGSTAQASGNDCIELIRASLEQLSDQLAEAPSKDLLTQLEELSWQLIDLLNDAHSIDSAIDTHDQPLLLSRY